MLRRTALMCFLIAAGWSALAEEAVRIGGTGSGTALLGKLAALYLEARPDTRIQIMSPSLGSTGGLRALAAGRIDIVVSGRPPRAEEGSFMTLDYARTPFVFASRGDHAQQNFSAHDIAEIHAGRKTRWHDGSPIRLILRSPFESDTSILRAMGAEMEVAIDDALRRMAAPIGENDLDTLALIEKLPGSFGPTSLGLIRLQERSLTIHRIDGIVPSAAELASGRYRLAKPVYLVTRPQADNATSEFVAFLNSPTAKTLLLKYEHLPRFR